MDAPHDNARRDLTRRALFRRGSLGLGSFALATLLPDRARANTEGTTRLNLPHHRPKAKRVIYLFMAGGPSHIDLFDYKEDVRKIHGMELPESIRQGQRLTTMTSGQKSFPCVAPMFTFRRHGRHGTWVSELLPHTARIVDDITIIKSMHTEAINHDPAITFINTGSQQPGKASLGAWLSYGLGSENRDLPHYVVMISRGNGNLQALYARLWGSGFLPSKHQGVKFRSAGDPVLYLDDPPGISRASRRTMLEAIARINARKFEECGDPETLTRTVQAELAFRMQASVPELMDLGHEPQHVRDLYGPDVEKPGTFARNCILARRMIERGVRFVQLFHRGWDQHGNLPRDIASQCRDTDQAAAGLVRDLKQRGLLDDTLVICGGEFGRTIYSQGALTETNHGRDHHGRCFHTWLAGGGVKAGFEYGKTDEFCYNIVEDPVHVRDFNATILHLLGIDHERFTFRNLGLDERPTGVEATRVVHEILA
ncbi:MAG: DUF1501 domain-containing protein [Planctomycetes bacterium]|nr:DUF1501 domain-containing protein [Planctomycetota bacterium]